jgi:hypothetical protein
MLIVNGTELVDLVAGKVKAYTNAIMSHSFSHSYFSIIVIYTWFKHMFSRDNCSNIWSLTLSLH